MSDVEQIPDEEFEIDEGGNNCSSAFKKSITTKSTITQNNSEIDKNRNQEKSNYSVINKNFKKYLNLFLKIIFSTPGLVVLVIGYSIMGAFLFPLLETPKELSRVAAIAKSREDCLRELWTITEKLNVLYEKNWTMLVHEQLRRFEGTIVAATRNGLNLADLEQSTNWSFSEALLYSITVITTIGHGNLTPKTSLGKIATIFYALIGVPLMLMCLSNLGELLAEALQCTYSKICCQRQQRQQQQQHQKQQQQIHKNDQDNHQHHNSCDGQSNEVNYAACKYDAITNESKLHTYRCTDNNEDSCHLLHNSPSKLSHTSSPCKQIKTVPHPIIKQYTSSLNNTSSTSSLLMETSSSSPVRHQHPHYHNSNQQYPSQYYPMTTLNCRSNMNTGSCRSVHPSTAMDSTNNLSVTTNISSNVNCTVASPSVTSSSSLTVNNAIFSSCPAEIHCNNKPIITFHTISLPQQQQKYQQYHQLINNSSPSKINHPHTATIHGMRHGKYIAKPMPQEINILLAENGTDDMTVSYKSYNSYNELQSSPNISQNASTVDIMEDEEENQQNRVGCSHGTPSRIPLIPVAATTSKCLDQHHHHHHLHYKQEQQHHHSQPHQDVSRTISEVGTSQNGNNDDYDDDNDDDEDEISTNENNYTVQVPIIIVLIILISYIFLGTIIFAFWENWSLIDGAYFCFITLSTIGYGGDFVPQKTFHGPNLQLFACCAYLLLGLVLVAMSFNVLEKQLMFECRKIAIKLKLAKD